MRYLLVFLPVLGAPLIHWPILRYDLLPALKRPLDGGRGWLGDNKTWRGAILMTGGVVIAAVALSAWDGWWDLLPAGVRAAGAPLYGLLLGLGIVIGELPNSLLKRRLGIEPGGRPGGIPGALLYVLDQGDLVLGAWLLLAPIWVLAPWQAAIAFAVIAACHAVVNVAGYLVGARSGIV